METDIFGEIFDFEDKKFTFLLRVLFALILLEILKSTMINLFTNLVSARVGDGLGWAISSVLFILIILVMFTHSKVKSDRYKKLKTTRITNSITLKKVTQYKGLIAFISEPPKKKNEDEWLTECKTEIDRARKSQDFTALVDLPSIGQTIRAINHHFGELKYCWLIHSEQSGVNVGILDYFFKQIAKGSIDVKFMKIQDPNNSKQIKEIIDNIYDKLPTDLKVNQVIADITAGNKPMTAGMVLSCTDPDRDIEYVEQSEKNELIQIEIYPKFTRFAL